VNPFQVLGLPVRPDLTDTEVRAAWRLIAATTHPDRPDGGDVAVYTAAAAAYTQLRTPWARSEAYADLTVAEAHIPAPRPPSARWPAVGLASPPRWPGAGLIEALRLIPARIQRGRPLRLLARALTAALLALLVLALIPAQPAGPAVVTGLVVWFFCTARSDLAPPPGR
jgi:hypothetical protein